MMTSYSIRVLVMTSVVGVLGAGDSAIPEPLFSPGTFHLPTAGSSEQVYRDIDEANVLRKQALARGDIDRAWLLQDDMCRKCVTAYGKEDPHSRACFSGQSVLYRVRSLPEEQQRQYCRDFGLLLTINDTIVAPQMSHTYLDLQAAVDVCRQVDNIAVHSTFTRVDPINATVFCGVFAARVLGNAGQWPEAMAIFEEQLRAVRLSSLAGSTDEFLAALLLIATDQEAGRPTAGRRQRWASLIDFAHNEGTMKDRFTCHEFRARAMLAEDFYRDGDLAEADRQFAELRRILPDLPPYDSRRGWIRFACDRHDTRRAFERGEYKEALEMVKRAEEGCKKYALYNVSTPITTRRLLELKARIVEKLGRPGEAAALVAQAQRIDAHLAEVRATLRKVPIRLPRCQQAPDGAVTFDFDHPLVIQPGEPAAAPAPNAPASDPAALMP